MRDIEPEREDEPRREDDANAGKTPVRRGNPRDGSSVAAANRYAEPETQSDLTPGGERPASPAVPLDRSVDRVEMERLRELLREQQQATLRAMHTAADLQNKLATAQTEGKTIGKQYYGFSKQARSAIAEKTAELEIEKIKAERRELDKQKQEKRAEALRAAEKITAVQKEVKAARVPVPPAASAPEPAFENRRVRHAMIGVAVAVALIGSSVVWWRASGAQSQPQAEEKAADTPSKSPLRADRVPAFPSGLSPEPAAALTAAMTQLDSVLSTFPGRSPEDILRQAARIDHSCRMQWNDGHPSLVFGGGSPQSNSLSSTISQCTEAVKRLH